MQKWVCDKCGEVIGTTSDKPFRVLVGDIDIEGDLCDRCFKELMDWLKENFKL